jgi:glutamate-ammonia-ligase adenylyltransferase
VLPELDKLIQASPDPQTTALRMERLSEDREIRHRVAHLPADLHKDFTSLISVSKFLFHFMCRHPDAIALLGRKYHGHRAELELIRNLDELRIYKYRELLKITWMDISGTCDYPEILTALSDLAVTITGKTLQLNLGDEEYKTVSDAMSIIALGKLGANELNYSSDIDLIFVSVNPEHSITEYQLLQEQMMDAIKGLNRALEQKTADGFLYRVDLKLRPWGNSGPLVMSIDDTEHYYEASSEPWERFAWLRARVIAGSGSLAAELLERLRPFIFMRSLGSDDLVRFVEIKDSMEKARKKQGHWNVKVGQGGIRDIEFFIQILQIVNAARNDSLQTTNTLTALQGLRQTGLISDDEEREIYRSYVFLRRLENRLQMFDEIQTHDLPIEHGKRLVLARSLYGGSQPDSFILDNFENELIANQVVAAKYFNRILPGKN